MKGSSFIKSFLAALFTGIVLLTVNIHGVHYLFVDHARTEHCENHLHKGDSDGHCTVCKFDVSLFTDVVLLANTACSAPLTEKWFSNYRSFNFLSPFFNLSLRGPPSFA
jgi:hypothetical protein